MDHEAEITYWNTVYKHSYERGEIPTDASSFAQSVLPVIARNATLVNLVWECITWNTQE